MYHRLCSVLSGDTIDQLINQVRKKCKREERDGALGCCVVWGGGGGGVVCCAVVLSLYW